MQCLKSLNLFDEVKILERWIEIDDGAYMDGFPKSKYKHESCGTIVDNCSPYCPQCGKRVDCVKILRNGFEDVYRKSFEKCGYTVEF